jgi:phosphoglycerate dehydrogenase-like enzyme
MKVLILPEWAEPACNSLRDRHPGIEIKVARSAAEANDHMREAEVLFGYPTSEQFDSASNLKWIQTSDAGMEGLFGQVPQVAESQVTVTNARGAGAPMIGEHALALMFALSRQLPRFWRDKQKHLWDQDGALDAVEFLGDKTVGVVGLGKSGREIAWRCRAMGMRVLAVDREAIDADPSVEFVWTLERLPDLLGESDYVVVTVPFSEANASLIGQSELSVMKRSARLIVTSRGRVFDNEALVTALKQGTIAGAAIDTVETEPLSAQSELWDLPNLIITPHIAGNAEKVMLDKRTFAIFEENLSRYLGSRPLLNVVDKLKQY